MSSSLNLGTLFFNFDVDTSKGSNKLKSAEDKVKNFGTSMQDVGKKMTMALTLPLAGLGVAAISTFAKFEQSMAKVQATCSGSTEEMAKLESKARELGQSTKFSASEVAEGFNYMAMAGWSASEMLDGIDHTLNLSIASGSELALVTDIVTDSLTAMKLEAKDTGHFTDIIAQTSRNANTNVELMGETMKYCAPTAGALGINMEDLSLAIGLMANAGIKGSQSGTSLRSGLVNLVKPTDNMAAAMKKYGISLIANADGSSNLRATMVNLRESLKDVEQQEQAAAVAAIFGKQSMAGWQAIINASEKDFNRLASAIDNSSGSTNEMAEIMGNTFQGKLNSLKSSFEEFLIVIGEKLLPLFTSVINMLTDAINWFNGLDESTQKLIVSVGVFAAAIGPAIWAIGSLNTGILKLSTAVTGFSLSKMTTGIASLNPLTIGLTAAIAGLGLAISASNKYTELLGTTILDTKDDMTLFEKVVASFTGIQKHSKEELIEMGLVYREFSGNVSEEFQTAFKNNQKAVYEFNAELQRVNLDDVLTEEEVDGLTEDVESLATSIINLIKENGAESRKELSDWFKVDDEKIDENEQLILDALDRIQEESITEITTLKDEINEIYQKALDEKRALSDEEIADVAKKHERLRQAELEALALTQEEMLIAQNTFGERVRNMDLENAISLATQQAEKRDENISQIKGYYDTKITLLEENLGKMNDVEKAAAIEEIKQLTEKRDGAINLENEQWAGILEQIAKNNPRVLEEMNKFNGTLLTGNDKKNAKLLSAQKFAYEDINKITKDGTYKVKSTIDGSWTNITVKTDQATGEIVGLYDHMTGKQFGYTKDMASNVGVLGENHNKLQKDISTALTNGEKAYVNAKNTITTESGIVIGQLENVTTAADGAKEGFVNINGTPVKIQTNADGTIKDLNAVKNAVTNIPKTWSVSVKQTTYKSTVNQPQGKSIAPLTEDTPALAREADFNFDGGFGGYLDIQRAQETKNNISNKVLEKIDKKMENLIKIASLNRVTKVMLDKDVLVEQVAEPIGEELMWRSIKL